MAILETTPLMTMKKKKNETEIELLDLMDREEFETTDESLLICNPSNCIQDPQGTALSALLLRHYRVFSDAISEDSFSADHIYKCDSDDDINEKTILQIAVNKSKGGEDAFIAALLTLKGVQIDVIDELTETSPLHDICRKGDPKLFQMVLNILGNSVDLNVQDGEGLTPLHVILESMQDADEVTRKFHFINLELILKADGIEPNAEDLRGNLTPLFYAANMGDRQAVELLLNHGANPDHEADGRKIKEAIQENIDGFDNFDQYAEKVKSRPLKSRQFSAVEGNDLAGIKRIKEKDGDWNADNGAMTLLQLAVEIGATKIVSHLLFERKADPNKTIPTELRSPILIAAHHGYYKILDIFKRHPMSDFTSVEPKSGRTALHEIFLSNSAKHFDGRKVPNASYEECFKILLDESNPSFKRQIDSIINYRETLNGDTALHYATQQSNQDVIKMFLHRGANMGIKNFAEKTAVERILPSTLESFLDEDCMTWDGLITDENFKLTFNYNFLAPPIMSPLEIGDDEEREYSRKDVNEIQQSQRALPETEPLWYMSMASKEHKMLLKHPVLASFLWLKWQRIRSYFYINLFLYLLFVALLTTFIFLRFGGKLLQPNSKNNTNNGTIYYNYNEANILTIKVLSFIIGALLVILSLRELFQMCVSFKRYFFSFENLVELAIIILSFIIIFDRNDDDNIQMNRHLAALVVLMTWSELLVLIGRHPRLSTNIVMFRQVVTTFLRFLAWYSIIIIAFGISFYIMMHTDYNNEEESDGGNPFFNTIGLALFKTSAMFVGELEFADIPFTGNIISNGVFLAFIFLIVVVLMNLLNGLAVSDTGLIRDEAEVVGWWSRVELITYTESMLLGDPFYFLSNWPAFKLLKKLPNLAMCRVLYKFPFIREILQKITGGTQILLFYSCLPNKMASFYPNKKSKSFMDYKKSLKLEENDEGSLHNRGINLAKLYVSRDVLDSAKALILEQMRSTEEEKIRREETAILTRKIDSLENIILALLPTVTAK